MDDPAPNTTYIHHKEGYAKLSDFQRNIIEVFAPYISRAAGEIKQNDGDTSFSVVDYGAADGVNSIPLIKTCQEIVGGEKHLVWILNDLLLSKSGSELLKLRGELIEHKGLLNEQSHPSECPLTLEFVANNFFNQVVPHESVDLGISVSAIHWLSQRPPEKCNLNPNGPDDGTHELANKDWEKFLLLRSKELKTGGRLVVLTYTSTEVRDGQANLAIIGAQRVIRDMFENGIITEEEYEFARVFPITFRKPDDLRKPFREIGTELESCLKLIRLDTWQVPDPFLRKWMANGGKDDIQATEEYVYQMVNTVKTFYNSFWTILNKTRSPSDSLEVLDVFYDNVQCLLERDLFSYHLAVSISIVECVKQ